MEELLQFLQSIESRDLPILERAIGILWLIGKDNPLASITAAEICKSIEAVGHPKQNVTRLTQKLKADHRATKAGRTGWRLHPKARPELDAEFGKPISAPQSLPDTDSVLPATLFSGTRPYITRVVEQINKSYDVGLWDCCAVMCRRLLETLIIEVYESNQRADELKGSDGHFKMLSGLLSHVEKDPQIHLGRSALRGLKEFKNLGDLSAHNRRFNARRDDIDRVRNGLRVAAEELLHLGGFVIAP